MTLGKLFWLQPDNTVIEFPLKSEQSVIGRSNRCEVRIKHPGISNSHALIRITKEATTVEDLGSTNGTRVNGKRIQVRVLRHGDQIGIGRERLMYFAELDDASTFIQPKAIEPYVLPAPIGERVNTVEPLEVKRPPHMPSRSDAPSTGAQIGSVTTSTGIATPDTASRGNAVRTSARSMPELDLGLMAALPMGTSLSDPAAVGNKTRRAALSSANSVVTPSAQPQRPASAVQRKSAEADQTLQPARAIHPVSASVSVLSGPAAGKNYPLEQPSVTLGKEGKQVVEILRLGQTRWQIKQREGVTPAYINGDALVGNRELAAGDAIELIGVRLRFDVALT